MTSTLDANETRDVGESDLSIAEWVTGKVPTHGVRTILFGTRTVKFITRRFGVNGFVHNRNWRNEKRQDKNVSEKNFFFFVRKWSHFGEDNTISRSTIVLPFSSLQIGQHGSPLFH